MQLSLVLVLLSAASTQGLRGDLSAVLNKFMFWPGDDDCYNFASSISPAADRECGNRCGDDEMCDAPASTDENDSSSPTCRRVPSSCSQYTGATNAPTQAPRATTQPIRTQPPVTTTTTTTTTPAPQVPSILADPCAEYKGMVQVTNAVDEWRPYPSAASRKRNFRAYWAFRFGTGSTECPSTQRTPSAPYWAFLPRSRACGYIGRLALCPDDKAAFKFLHTSPTECNKQCKKSTTPTRPTASAGSCTVKTIDCRRPYRSFNAPRFRNQYCTDTKRQFAYNAARRTCVPYRYYGCNPYSSTKEAVPDNIKTRFRATNQFDTLEECKETCCQ